MNRARLTTAVMALCALLSASECLARDASAPADDSKFPQYLASGTEALEAGEYKKAIRAFSKADGLSDGKSAEPVIGLALAHLRLDQYQDALRYVRQAVERTEAPEERAVADNLLGTILYTSYQVENLGDKERKEVLSEAESCFRRALDLSAGQLKIAWSNLAQVLETQDRLAEAQAALQGYLERVPDDQSAIIRLDKLRDQVEWEEIDQRWPVLVNEGRLAEAITLVVAYLERVPDHPGAHYRFCWLQMSGIDSSKIDDLPVKVQGDIQPPEKIFTPAPLYTEDARRARIQGVVVLEAVIDREGKAKCVRILKGLPMGLGTSAVETLKRWQFKPATHDGEPVAVEYHVTARFRLEEDRKE